MILKAIDAKLFYLRNLLKLSGVTHPSLLCVRVFLFVCLCVCVCVCVLEGDV